MKYFTEQIQKIIEKYILNKKSYFSRDINLMIIDYLNNEGESLRLLKILRIKKKYYTTKYCYDINELDKAKYRVNNIIIYNMEDLNKIKDLKIKKSRLFICFNENEKIDNYPKNVERLTFGHYFNQSVDNLPKNLTHLIFGELFNQPVLKLPNTITHLKFRDEFNKEVDNLPKGLINLTFGWKFDQKVDNLPNSMKIRGCSASSYLV